MMKPHHMRRISDILTNNLLPKLAAVPHLVNKPKTSHSFRPIITVSREPGSGGRPIAEMVAKTLRFELYDEKFIEDIAKSTKRRADLIKSVDEKARGIVTDVLQSILNPDYISDMTYIRHAAKVILTRAHRGKAIFLDRGANFIIPTEWALRVRIQAPYAVRVARAVKHEGIDATRARSIIQKHDAERKDFVRQYFDKNISNANSYDLVLNTTHMTLEDARDLIIFAFKKKFRVK